MSSSQLPQKRPRPTASAAIAALNERNLSEMERRLLDLVISKGNEGIKNAEARKVLGVTVAVFNKLSEFLIARMLVKNVVDIRTKSKSGKLLMGYDIEPSAEISGGAWNPGGVTDTALVNAARRSCLDHLAKLGNRATIPQIFQSMSSSSFRRGAKSTVSGLTLSMVAEIMQNLMLDNEVYEVVENGTNFYKKVENKGAKLEGALASIPCGACPRSMECTPDGIISPDTCVYYNKWFDALQSKDASELF